MKEINIKFSSRSCDVLKHRFTGADSAGKGSQNSDGGKGSVRRGVGVDGAQPRKYSGNSWSGFIPCRMRKIMGQCDFNYQFILFLCFCYS